MARTYDRIRVLLREIQRNQSPGNRQNLSVFASQLSRRRVEEFLLDRRKDSYLSDRALKRLLKLIAKMNLVEISDDALKLTRSGLQALQGNNYDRMLSTAALEYLSGYRITLQTIYTSIEAITLPDVPEAKRIFDGLESTDKDRLGFDRFRMILHLLHCSNRLMRQVKVMYGRRH
jgi:hypothetical protein